MPLHFGLISLTAVDAPGRGIVGEVLLQVMSQDERVDQHIIVCLDDERRAGTKLFDPPQRRHCLVGEVSAKMRGMSVLTTELDENKVSMTSRGAEY